jgi:hypothetical protein
VLDSTSIVVAGRERMQKRKLGKINEVIATKFGFTVQGAQHPEAIERMTGL